MNNDKYSSNNIFDFYIDEGHYYYRNNMLTKNNIQYRNTFLKPKSKFVKFEKAIFTIIY